MRTEPLSPALGVSVTGVDLRRPLDADTRTALHAAFLEHHLLLFQGQPLTDDEHVAAVRDLGIGPIAPEARGDFSFVSNTRPDGILGSTASCFHIDYGFFERPYEALSLCGIEIPDGGTETSFVNAVLAARTLPDDLRGRVEGLQARQIVDVTSPAGEAGIRVRAGRLDESYPHTVRPVLWPHRETGEHILGVWQQQTDAILPLEPDDSTALIEELFAHLYRPEHTYVHRWAENDLLVWDNHAVQHGRADVGVERPRTLRRVCVGQTQDLSIFADYMARRGPTVDA